jgi:hypothetical protein
MALGMSLSAYLDSSARQVIKSKPRKAKNMIAAPLTVPAHPYYSKRNGVKFSLLK